jgi:hypothetical protein
LHISKIIETFTHRFHQKGGKGNPKPEVLSKVGKWPTLVLTKGIKLCKTNCTHFILMKFGHENC